MLAQDYLGNFRLKVKSGMLIKNASKDGDKISKFYFEFI